MAWCCLTIRMGARSDMSEAAKIKEEMRALAESRKAKHAARASAKEIADLKQRLADNTAIADAEEKIGEQGVHIFCAETPDGRVVILKRAPYALFREHQEKKSATTDDLESLVEACRHYPDEKVFDAILEEFPGFLTILIKGVLKLAGSLQEDTAKK